MADLSGKTIGKYQIIEKLGEGGMAVVYRALDTKLQRDVALKILRIEELAPGRLERIQERFRQEAEKTAALTHPNIVTVLDYGEYEGAPYLVMQYVPGGTLKQKLDSLGKPMPYPEAARLLAPIARALDTAHRMKLVHRDVKPANILITLDGEPMLTDFGVARALESEKRITLDGYAIGTPEYMAPEQWESKELDGRADEYALGVVFFEMITGKLPFTADTIPAIMMKAMREELPIPGELAEDAKDVLRKAMGKKPEERFPDLLEFARELDKLGQQEAEALTAPDGEVKQWVEKTYEEIGDGKAHRKLNRLWLVLLPVAIVAIGFGIWKTIPAREIITPIAATIAVQQPKVQGQTVETMDITATKTLEITLTATETSVVKVEEEAIPAAFNLDEFGGLFLYDKIDTGDQPITSIAITPDGKYLAATTGKDEISLWDVSVKPAKFYRKLEGIQGTIVKLNFSQDGQYLAGIVDETNINFWKMPELSLSSSMVSTSTLINIRFVNKTLVAINEKGRSYNIESSDGSIINESGLCSERDRLNVITKVFFIDDGSFVYIYSLGEYIYFGVGAPYDIEYDDGSTVIGCIATCTSQSCENASTSIISEIWSKDSQVNLEMILENGKGYLGSRGGRMFYEKPIAIPHTMVDIMEFTHDNRLAITTSKNQIRLVNLVDGLFLEDKNFSSEAAINSLLLLPNKACLATGEQYGIVAIICEKKIKQTKVIETQEFTIEQEKGKHLYPSNIMFSSKQFSKLKTISSIVISKNPIKSISVTDQGSFAVATDGTNKVFYIDLTNDPVKVKYENKADGTYAENGLISSKGKYFGALVDVQRSKDYFYSDRIQQGKVIIWDSEGKLNYRTSIGGNWRKLVFSSNENQIYFDGRSESIEGNIGTLDLATGKFTWGVDNEIINRYDYYYKISSPVGATPYLLAESNDGTRTIVAEMQSSANYISVFDKQGNLSRFVVPKEKAQHIIFSQDPDLLFITSKNRIRPLEIPNQKFLTEFDYEVKSNITSIALVKEKGCLVVGEENGTVELVCLSEN